MAISYNRLWKRLIDHDLSKTDMMHRANISTNVLARLGKGAPVSMESMEKICKVLNCNIGDVMEFVPDNGSEGRPPRATSTLVLLGLLIPDCSG